MQGLTAAEDIGPQGAISALCRRSSPARLFGPNVAWGRPNRIVACVKFRMRERLKCARQKNVPPQWRLSARLKNHIPFETKEGLKVPS